MLYRVLSDVVVLIHFSFVMFVVFGGFLVLRWKHLAIIHVPAFLWGALIEFAGWVCPLTPLENWLRIKGGAPAYQTGFIEHYIFPLLYPIGLTRTVQIVLGFGVLGLNVGLYGWLIWRAPRQN